MSGHMARRHLKEERCSQLPQHFECVEPSDCVGNVRAGAMKRVTMKEIVAYLDGKVAHSMAYSWVEDKTLPHLRLSAGKGRGEILVEEADLTRFFEACRVGPHPLLKP